VDNASVEVETNGDTPSSLSVFINDDFCFGANEGVLVIESVLGGTPPYLYSLNGGSFGTDNIFSGLAPGNYQITVQDVFGCEYSDSYPIDAPTELQVGLSAVGLGANAIPLGDQVDLVVSLNIPASDVASVTWTPEPIMAGCGDPCLTLTVTPDETTFYTVTVVDSNGCAASADIVVPVDKSRPVYVPNAFSPNGDGINDLLVIFGGKSVATIKSFLVFSRWGEIVFEGYQLPHSDFNFGWDGTYRGKILDPGVYTWFAEVEFSDGETIMYEGDVTLIR
jgi:gliding motility-associated-like protein